MGQDGQQMMDTHARLEKKGHIRNFNIASWNVRSLDQPGKLDNVELEAERLKIDVLGISEVRWT